ncbi:MAG: hypothetical protein ACRD26_03900 [Vicinamibacterales bacterium]
MRFNGDYPRRWAELLEVLTPDEAAGCRAYARSRGVRIESLSAPAAERVFTEWRLAGSPPAADGEGRH